MEDLQATKENIGRVFELIEKIKTSKTFKALKYNSDCGDIEDIEQIMNELLLAVLEHEESSEKVERESLNKAFIQALERAYSGH